MAALIGQVTGNSQVGVIGESTLFEGVRGIGHAVFHAGVVGVNDNPTDGAGPGVYGESVHGEGVRGISHSNVHGAVVGACDAGAQGVYGESAHGEGVRGVSHSNDHGAVVGTCDAGAQGVYGESAHGEGVRGVSHSNDHGAVVGTCDAGAQGVYGESAQGEGVRGVGHSALHGAVVGTNDNPAGVGIFGQGGRLAGQFQGDVEVTGTLSVGVDVRLTGADCAEHFAIEQNAMCEPGTVMSIGAAGTLHACSLAYDKRVAGVISGAGIYRPAIILDQHSSDVGRSPVALFGKVFCKVDAKYAAIEIGDLLTTSETPGHAMRAADMHRSFGSVIGKALGPLSEGRGMVPILVTLQ